MDGVVFDGIHEFDPCHVLTPTTRFRGDTAYTATITVTPEEGYTFGTRGFQYDRTSGAKVTTTVAEDNKGRIVTIIFPRTEPLEPVTNLNARIDTASSTSVWLTWTNPSNDYFRQFHPFVNVHEIPNPDPEGWPETEVYIDYSYSHIMITYDEPDGGEKNKVIRIRAKAPSHNDDADDDDPPWRRPLSAEQEAELQRRLELADELPESGECLLTDLTRGKTYTFTVTAVYDCMNTDDNGYWDVHYEPLSDQSAPVQITIEIPK
jgi:hypothetical protein